MNQKDKTFTTEELVKLYESGMSLRQLAELAGVSHQAIYKRLKRAGAVIRHVGLTKGQKINRKRSSKK